MIERIDTKTGCALMREYGLTSWPDVETRYYSWGGCAVFALPDCGEYVEIHMAMRRDERWRCRSAVADVLAMIGNREIHAPILMTSRHVRNLAQKFGFVYDSTILMEFAGGGVGEVILMIRRAENGRNR